ncbi:NlpC/P60 family protein [Clostridium saccharoperbutylacetonicum]|uniref:C40 family peptidase n=1 Tax=Clostridium saccharoperbutylacetonicum TaxID=36745 RepID=UPI000983E4E8|nr:C40 family peptidase [Clostridium saccharoperbutylacetonicum]AQR94026.1 putative endopeptidase p60 precursor [Clostridium saccharoperbutylacetonicum]NSB29725.1 cell wall-associated NlpC family hydrolase [Clostridium saccharoperbutylacetonicum]
MKNKILALVLATVIISGNLIPVSATPSNEQLDASRQKYADIENKIKDIEAKIYDLDMKMEPLQASIDKNKAEIRNINIVTENTKKDIEQCKKDINDLDLALGKRVKIMYSSGDLEFNYLNFILNSDSTSEFFSRVQAVGTIIEKDKSYIDGIKSKRIELNDKVKSLDDKKTEINKLNKEVQDNLNQLASNKKAEQELAAEAQNEKSKFDVEYLSLLERDAVKTQFDVIDSSNSSSADIEGAVSQLASIRDNQIKSPIVTKEINDKIQKGKAAASKKKDQEAKAAAESQRQAQAQVSSTSTKSSSSSNKKSNSSVAAPAAGNAQAILNEAYKHLGKSYVWGATGPSNFDCSGFTEYVYEHAAGIDISRTTYTQINVGQPVSQDQLKPGDLVFPHAGHVGIYVGNGQMIHAPQTGDVVKVGPVYSFYAGRRIL